MATELEKLVDQGKQAFAAKKYDQATASFKDAATAYEAKNDALHAAEMKNNLSVALLQTGKPQAAYEAAIDTDKVFAKTGDVKRQAMAIGNQAAALEALKKYDQALEAYERSAEHFREVDESEMRSMVLQSAAAIKLRRGKFMDSAFSMIGSVDATKKPNLMQKIVRRLLRIIS